jgi:hypothetical protein
LNGYVAGGWGATAGILALYTWRLLRRGRLLSRALPPPDGGDPSRPFRSLPVGATATEASSSSAPGAVPPTAPGSPVAPRVATTSATPATGSPEETRTWP